MLQSSGCSDPNSREDKQPIPVRSVVVTQHQVPEVLEFSANIVPWKVIEFGFMVAGKIKEVAVVEGEYVEQGQLIAVMEPTDYHFALDAARAQYEEAVKEYDRLKNLYDKGSLTQSDLDKITALKEEATANYDYKQKQVHDTRLYAPASGWLAVEGIEPGEIIPQGYPVFGLIQTYQVFAQAAIPENEINQIRMHQKVSVRIPALDDRLFEGRIERIGQIGDAYSRSYSVKALVNNPGYLLKAGMIAFLDIPTGDTVEQITIPLNAVVTNATGHNFVFVVLKDHVTRRPVTLGPASRNEVQITGGLHPEEVIVTEGITNLYEGAPVEYKP